MHLSGSLTPVERAAAVQASGFTHSFTGKDTQGEYADALLDSLNNAARDILSTGNPLGAGADPTTLDDNMKSAKVGS